MDRPFPLRDEDRADYASALDDVIGSAEIRHLLARSRIGTDQLRVRGLAAGPHVASAAESAYRSYADLRRQIQNGGPADRATPLSGPGHQEDTGAGLVPVLAVLTPVLAAVAAATFLLLGYVLRLAGSAPAMAGTLIAAGWICLGIAAFTAAFGILALYRTAAAHREPRASSSAVCSPGLDADLDRAREAWLRALRHNGIGPFLVEQLRREPVEPLGQEPAAPEPGRSASSGHRPRYSSPDFSSPDFGRPDFSSPDFVGPGFSGPDLPGTRRP
ncbi:hypothetical protein ABZ826_26785 [Streptomyces sp. NPDC047515]|uniref:hypothetical protein n=1 Tax=Streptomyces sp. NPDC047515 TaxID=3155380 RepID=UPI003405838C